MLTNLDFLSIGEKWPPVTETARLEQYEKNRQLFEGRHDEVYKAAFKRIERVIGNFQEVISYSTVINFQKKISLKTADFLWLEPPKIKAGADDSAEQQALKDISDRSDLNNTGYSNTLDVSRYGDGLLLIYKDGDRGRIDVTQPSGWILVVDEGNVKRVINHVLFSISGEKDQRKLTVQIHYRGYFETRVHRLVGGSFNSNVGEYIGPMLEQRQEPTGLSDFAIVQIPNVMTSERCYGLDDYMDVDSIVSEILVRVAQISKVLDKHADPSVQGPQSALERDPVTGLYRIKLGNYFSRDDKEDPTVEYVTWDGQLEAAFRQLSTLINFLGVISEMGSAVFDNGEKPGAMASGTALRLRYVSLLAKIKRVSLRYTPALIKAIKLCSELGGLNLTKSDISVVWQDGLPNDEKERADIASVRTGAKPTWSQKEAIMYLDDKTEEQAQETYEQILEEEAARAPAPLGGSFDEPDNTDEEPPEE